MPNWCENTLVIKKTEGFDLKEVLTNDSLDFNKIIYGVHLASMNDNRDGGVNMYRSIASYLDSVKNGYYRPLLRDMKPKKFTREDIINVYNNIVGDIANILFGGAKYKELNVEWVDRLVHNLNVVYGYEEDETAKQLGLVITEDDIKNDNDINIGAGKSLLFSYLTTGQYGWYDFCVEKWGSKWNATRIDIWDDEKYYHIYFNTAWSPVEPIVKELAEKYKLTLYYNYLEMGMAFAGEMVFKDGELVNTSYGSGDTELIYAEVYAMQYPETMIKIVDGENVIMVDPAGNIEERFEDSPKEKELWDKITETVDTSEGSRLYKEFTNM